MTDILNSCVIDYKADETTSNIKKAKQMFEKFGYKVSLINNVTNDELSSQIIAGNPVYMRGYNGSKGHAWVCDGYKWIRDMVIATLIKNPNDPKLKIVNTSPNGFMIYDATGLKNKVTDDGKYFQMKFGWGGDSNGWYYGFNYDIPNNYTIDQQILTVKKK